MAVVMIIVLFPSAMGDEKVLDAEYRTEADGMSCQVVQDGYEASFYINGTWQTGYNVSAVIRNTTAENIDNWTVSLAFEGKIVNIWDAVIVDYEESLNTYIISNAGYNEDIAPYSCVQFGFTADAVDKESGRYPLPTDCKMLQKEENLTNGTFSVRWHFSDAYNGTVYIKNESDKDISDWTLGFDTDLKIYSFYTAETLEEKTAEGTHYVIKNRGYNSDIKDGEELSLGFSCSYVGEETMTNEALFRNFVLSDVRNGVMQTVVTPETTEEPTATPEPTAVVTPEPTEEPTATPEPTATTEPTAVVTPEPTEEPTATPEPTAVVTPEPTEEPTATPEPTAIVTPEPTKEPIATPEPTALVTPEPTEEPTATPEPTATATPIPEEDENDLTDTDGDGLPDVYELEIGSDCNLADTDGDGISDLLEFINDLDPLTADEYFESETDVDGDGLFDYEEIYVYFTDPLNFDTDNDGLSDGFEITNGFDPLKEDTDNNGIIDGKERFSQETVFLSDDFGGMYSELIRNAGGRAEIFGEEEDIPINIGAITEVRISADIAGNIRNEFSVENMYGEHVFSTYVPGLVGVPLDITTTAEFDTVNISFVYDESLLYGADETKLGIVWFNEETNLFEIVDGVSVNTVENTVSFTTDHFTVFSLLNMEEFLNAWKSRMVDHSKRNKSDYDEMAVELCVDTGCDFFKQNQDEIKESLKRFTYAALPKDSFTLISLYKRYISADSGEHFGDFDSENEALL